MSRSGLGTADAALLSVQERDEHNETLLLSSACLVLLTDDQSDC